MKESRPSRLAAWAGFPSQPLPTADRQNQAAFGPGGVGLRFLNV